MNQLEKTLTSLEVAEMVDREHKEVLRDIRNILSQIGESKIALSYFIESTYQNSQNKHLPCYNLTKKGCELYSTRMTGEKGTQFAVAYIERFNKMENHIKQNEINTSNLSPELQMFNGLFQSLAKQELATKQLETKVDGIRDVVALNTTDWRKDARQLISKIAQSRGGFEAYKEVNNEIYKEVERRGGYQLSVRLTNKRRRLADEGVSKSKRDKLSKVDVIADDKRITEIYVAVVKEFAIKNGVTIKEAN
ncbi:phage regulatory protein, rha family [Halolactibacillus halophilus]|uniref:Phage regulatory protein, rha family n=1 Tax=Halolactibacillus halophilus TaxID=306540 RepID=A0A1I5MQY4_9BACI|nr:Rha family transcriptional regulator [Halolactibacillus halophilus]GEM01224.1 hypothetical protein HHA03_07560 [Halolactibacillus halophilus]SFP11737.1 phage regulatory protein, rha family [Halolactibacillus halophilus]